MWFDVRNALARIEAEKGQLAAQPAATSATSATRHPAPAARVAEVASVAGRQGENPKAAASTYGPRAVVPDAETYVAFLCDHGPATYGAAAAGLGWGATRAGQAEARPRAAGRVRFDHFGRAELVGGVERSMQLESLKETGKTIS